MMIREILFRGKTCHNKQWIFGNLCKTCNGAFFILPVEVSEQDGHHFMVDSDSPLFVDPETIGQFTGLLDKNGKKIFEGDVVKAPVKRLSRSNWWQKTNKHHGFVGDFVYKIVKFEVTGDTTGFEFYDLPITRNQIEEIEKPRGKERGNQAVDAINFIAKETETIGNIHDNPGLCK